MGALPPTVTEPIRTGMERRRGMVMATLYRAELIEIVETALEQVIRTNPSFSQVANAQCCDRICALCRHVARCRNHRGDCVTVTWKRAALRWIGIAAMVVAHVAQAADEARVQTVEAT